MGSESHSQVHTWAPPLICYVSLGKLFKFSELLFCLVENDDNSGSHLQGLENACKMLSAMLGT